MEKKRPLNLFLYIILSLFFLEAVFRLATAGEIFDLGLVVSFLFALSAAALLSVPLLFFPEKGSRRFVLALLLFGGFVFSSQFIYFRFFRTFYSLYSAGNFPQVLAFWREISQATLENFPWLLLFFLPALLLGVPGKKFLSYKRPESRGKFLALLASLLLLAHTGGLMAVFAGGRGTLSAYDLYHDNSHPLLSIERLGLLTSMRLDLQRLASGWSPALEASRPPEGPDLPEPGEPGDEVPEEPEAEVIEYNVLDIDFPRLNAGETDETLKKVHRYFSQVPPTEKNEYTGKYAGYNLILITAESYAPYAARENVTPTLYKMVNQGFRFTNFYTPLWDVSTTDGEYVALTGLIPKSGTWSFHRSGSNHLPFVMGNQLKNLGYTAVAYHNHTYTFYRRHISHPNMGYDYKGVGNGLKIRKQWPASDLEMMKVSIPEYIDRQPFHAYYITVSGHLEYNFSGNHMAKKNRELVEDLPYPSQGLAYLATQVELDRALEYLLNKLEEAGIAEQTLIVLSSDHYPYGLDHKVIDQLAGQPVERHLDLHRNDLIIYTPGMEPVTVTKPASSLDIIPTLSNLMGLEFDSRLLMGRDIFSSADPLVIFRDHSFITHRGRYNAQTQEFTPSRGPVEESYIQEISDLIRNKFYYSALILEQDYYRKVMEGSVSP